MVTKTCRACAAVVFAAGILLELRDYPNAAAAADPVAADCNRSGGTDAVDVQLVVNAVLGLGVAFPTDVDHSSHTDAVDVQLVVNAVLGVVIDRDLDGLCDGAESNLGSDPDVFDTDGDGVGDGAEILAGTDPTVSDAAQPGHWVEALHAAPWEGRYGHACVVHDEKLWVMGGTTSGTVDGFRSDIWSSPDGVEWTRVSEPGLWPWWPRHNHAALSFDGKLWVLGGWTAQSGGTARNDVLSSPDGHLWTEVTSAAPWPGRMAHSAVVHDGKMWVLGGYGFSDVWSSTDGEQWDQAVAQISWPYRAAVPAAVLGGRFWVLGGGGAQNDVWHSLDGVDWQQLLLHAPWSVRGEFAVDVYHNSLVVLGGVSGSDFNDVWYSPDGERWWQEDMTPRWASRRGHATASFDGKLWVIGGYAVTYTPYVQTYYNDVWYFEGDWECEAGEPNAAPRVQLVADPPAAFAPGEIMFQAVAVDRNCDCLTYAWDFGDGTPLAGTATMLRAVTEEGVYSAKVTVSDGTFQATDSIEVTVEAAPYTEASLDGKGGSVSYGDCAVSVPAGVLDRPVSFRVTELADMTPEADDYFEPSRFEALGAAYRIDTPLRSPTPMTLELDYDALPPGATPDRLALLVRLLIKGDPGDSAQGPLSVDYALFPPRLGPKQGTAQFDLHDGTTAQLVLLDAPLTTVGFRTPKSPALSFTVVFNEDPTALDKPTFANVVDEALTAAFNNYIIGKGCPGPDGAVTVVVKTLRGMDGAVPVNNPLMVMLNKTLGGDRIRQVAPHEFFHVVQGMCTNVFSAKLHLIEDAWFDEGTADWAADEVYDALAGTYHAPTAGRFFAPLNRAGLDEWAYQTVAFWKWIESESPGTILTAMREQRDLTHVILASGAVLEYPFDATRFLTFTTAVPQVDFIEYAASALYWKDFDTNETGNGDLWTTDQLGSPGKLSSVLGEDANWIHHVKQGVGDAEDNPLTFQFYLYESLTADTNAVATEADLPAEEKLHGRLHIRWPKTEAGKTLDAVVLAYQGDTVLAAEVVRDLTQSHDDTVVPFYSDGVYRAGIIVVDPRWQAPPPDTAVSGEIKVWVADCGPWPGTVTEVTNTNELVNALKTVPPGNTIHMAPGAYSPPVQAWDFPNNGWVFQESLFVNGVTLVGSGADETTIYLNPPESAEILTYGNASLRDMRIYIGNSWAVFSAGGHLKMCNVETTGGIDVIPFDPGSHSLTLTNCKIENWRHEGYGVYLEADSSEPPNSITATIEDTVIHGWEYGVRWWTWSDSGSVSVAADCDHFYDNLEGNVVQWTEVGNLDTEYCPDGLPRQPAPKNLAHLGHETPGACGCEGSTRAPR